MDNRIGVLGDIHCQDKKLKIALKYLDGKVNQIYGVGDIVDGNGDCEACIDQLKDSKVLSVKGNHDRWFLNNEMRGIPGFTKSNEIEDKRKEYLIGLPQTISLIVNRYRILVCHGINKNDMAMLKPDDYGYGLECKEELWELIHSNKFDLMISGHTHQDMVRKIDKMWIVNAGSFDSEVNANFIIIDLKKSLVQSFSVTNNSVELKQNVTLTEG